MIVGDWAGAIGKGLFAGVAGTAAMTVSSTLEARTRGRQPSSTPATAAGKVLGVEPTGEKEKARFSNIVHWGYGTNWGAVRGVIAAMGLHGVPAAGLFFCTIWGTELVMLPSLGVTSPPFKWGAKELAIDAFHHLVYSGTTSAVYEYLDS